MAYPTPPAAIQKKKDLLDDLVDARMASAPPLTTQAQSAADAKAGRVQLAKQEAKAASAEKTKRNGPMPDGLDELAVQRTAAAEELDVGRAQALQGAAARAGAGGFGLSGGTSAMLSDIGRQQDRNKVLTMADFDRMMSDQKFTDLQRQAAADEFEATADFDYNDDGFIMGEPVGDSIGDRNPDNDIDTKAPAGLEQQAAAIDDLTANLATYDYSWWDENTEAGSIQEPYQYSGTIEDLKAWYEANAPESAPLKMTKHDTGKPGEQVIVYTDKNGKSYVVSALSSSGKPSASGA